jgi:hypothetical protein
LLALAVPKSPLPVASRRGATCHSTLSSTREPRRRIAPDLTCSSPPPRPSSRPPHPGPGQFYTLPAQRTWHHPAAAAEMSLLAGGTVRQCAQRSAAPWTAAPGSCSSSSIAAASHRHELGRRAAAPTPQRPKLVRLPPPPRDATRGPPPGARPRLIRSAVRPQASSDSSTPEAQPGHLARHHVQGRRPGGAVAPCPWSSRARARVADAAADCAQSHMDLFQYLLRNRIVMVSGFINDKVTPLAASERPAGRAAWKGVPCASCSATAQERRLCRSCAGPQRRGRPQPAPWPAAPGRPLLKRTGFPRRRSRLRLWAA